MTYNIVRVLLIVLPFIVVPNEYDCFRSIKESLFQIGSIALLASLFFDTKMREYKNKYLGYFLLYLGISFFRFFSMAYIWGGNVRGTQYRTIINTWNLLPTINIILGFIMLKVIIENLKWNQVRTLIKLTCFVTFIISCHLILQRLGVFQIYGHDNFDGAKGWLSANRTIGFLGNPMVAGGFVSIASQFNLFFRKRINYVFYFIAFVATVVTSTTTAPAVFIVCAFIYFIIYRRSVGICLGILSIIGLGAAFKFKDFYSFSDRLEVWKQTVEWWWKMPYTGLGLGNFRTHNLLVKTTRWWQVHSEPLQILHELGILGFSLVGLIVIDFYRRLKFKREVFVCGLVVFSGILNSITTFPLHIAPTMFLIIIGFAFKEILEQEDSNGS